MRTVPPWLPQWTVDVSAFSAFVHTRCALSDPNWLRFAGRTYSAHARRPWRSVKRYLIGPLQGTRCVWCGKPLPQKDQTLEHMIPFQSSLWDTMTPLEQLLSLRVSHAACNHAYQRLRIAAPRTFAAQDRWRLRAIRRVIAYNPYWALWMPDRIPPVWPRELHA